MSDINFWQNKFKTYLLEHFSQDDGSHDLSHFDRVFSYCRKISKHEDADQFVLLAASYFHDFVNLPKDHPERHLASAMSAKEAVLIISEMNYPADFENIAHTISAHSFSANIEAKTIEAKILQDADRLEAIGAIGIARCFYVSGKLNGSLFDGVDPMALHRNLDDKKFALDHFHTKLYKLPDLFKTIKGKEMAQERVNFMKDFESRLIFELEN
jgi:uncharacterized protein